MNMYFSNSIGRVSFSFSGTGSVRVTELKGISNPTIRYSTSLYAETGQTAVLSQFAEPRRITVGGDILCGRYELSRLASVLSRGGELSIISKGKKRRIYCDEVSFSTGERYGQYIRYSILFTCYDPYFTDFSVSRVTVHSRGDLIYPEFTLPCVFTEAVCGNTAVNCGDVSVMPVFSLRAHRSGTADITLHNRSTGSSASFSYDFSAGETLTVDCENRTVVASVGGDALSSLKTGSLLSSLALERGANFLELTALDTTQDFDCFCNFRNKYCEGEY